MREKIDFNEEPQRVLHYFIDYVLQMGDRVAKQEEDIADIKRDINALRKHDKPDPAQ